jgi:GNAT superfamily N-acetyltransferase
LSASDGPALREFYRAVWNSDNGGNDTEAGDATVQCPFTPHPPPFVGVYSGAQLIGHLGSIPTQFWDGQRDADAHWLKGLMVLEQYRNGPIGYQLVKEMMKQVSLTAVMTVALPARRLFQAVGFKDMGPVPNYVTVVRPIRVLRAIDVERLGLASLPRFMKVLLSLTRLGPVAWLGGGVGAIGLGVLDGVNRLRTLGLRIRFSGQPPATGDTDALWQKLRAQTNLAPSRGGSYIRWRYAGAKPGRYEFIDVRRGGRLAALVVVRRPERVDDPRLAGLNVGLVVDLVVDPTDAAAVTAAFLATRKWAKKAACDAVLLTLSHLGVGRLVKPLGFVKIPGNVHFMLRAPAGALNAPQDTARSWLTRGDAWGDDI